jgi:ribosomal protein S4
MANIYKPRYKICYQVKNKVWINKNSKINSFNNFRSPRQGVFFARKRLKSMKWVIIRRFLIPRIQKRSHGRFKYKNMFQKKQQIKKFYGRIKEYQLQHIFKNKWKQQKSFKQNVFASVLEKRLDVILYRAKIFPTIFACNQFITHQGVIINNNLIKSINYPLKYEDIISFHENQWELIYERLHYKMLDRHIGDYMLSNYYYKTFLKFKKRSRYKRPFKNKFKLAHEIKRLKFRYMQLTRMITNLEKNNNYPKDKLSILSEIAYTKIGLRINKIDKLTNSFGKEKNKISYHEFEKELILLILICQKYINKFVYIYKTQQILLLVNDQIKLNKLLKNCLDNYNSRKNELIPIGKLLFLRGNFNVSKKFLKYKKRKKDFIYNKGRKIKGFYKKPHWYTPNYMEINYNTLQLSIISSPEPNKIFYPFLFSFDELITFYRYKGL